MESDILSCASPPPGRSSLAGAWRRPIDRVEAPIDRVEAPIDRVEAPIDRVEAPIDRVSLKYTIGERLGGLSPQPARSPRNLKGC